MLPVLSTGAGKVSSSGGSGGSHGAPGGIGYGGMLAGAQYGSIFQESTWGSGGGSYSPGDKNGGIGGGYVHVYTSEEIIISGNIRADGRPSTVRHLFTLYVHVQINK